MQGRNGEIRWLAGMAVVAALIAGLLLIGQPGPAAVAQAAQTPTPTGTVEPLAPTPDLTPTPMITPTATITPTPMITPTEPITPVVLPELGVAVRTLLVVGHGTVQAAPDIAMANIGVTAIADTVLEATQQVSETMAAIMDALMAEGVAEEDIRTTTYNISMIDGVIRPGEPVTPGEQQFQATSAVDVIIRDIDNIGGVIGAAVDAGANQVFGVNFALDDPEPMLLEAMEEAVQNAEERAQRLAELAGVQLGPVVSISQVVGVPGIPFAAAEVLGVGGARLGPVAPGQLDITTQVQVIYELQ